MFLSLTSTSIPRDEVPSPHWARAGLQRRRTCSSANAGGPALHSSGRCGFWRCFLFLLLFKEKTKLSTLPTCEMHLHCRRTIILQSHNDPWAKKKRKSRHSAQSQPWRVNLWKSPGRARSNSHCWGTTGGGEAWARERRRKEEAQSLKVKTNVNLTPALYEQHPASPLDK